MECKALMATIEERVSQLEGGYEHLATKADIARLESTTKADIARLEGATKADIARLEGTTKADIARLEGATKADIAEVKGEVRALRGEVRLLLTGMTVGLAALALILKYLG